MKNPLRFFIFSIIIGVIISCNGKKPEPKISGNEVNNIMLSDSINILDSLVNLYKASNHELAYFYSRRALAIALFLRDKEVFARTCLIIGVAYKNFHDDSSLSPLRKGVL